MIKKRQSLTTTIFKLSRPIFWLYLAGPYLIAYTALANQSQDFFRFSFFYSLFFFLIPANIILYGINDIYDQDTDALNPKKEHREQKITPQNKKIYVYAVIASFLLAIPLFIYLPIFAKLLLFIFFLLAIFYSAKPFRLKAKPFVDSAANILYGFPAFIAIYQLTSNGLTTAVCIAIFCWCAAMHLFSAIPDIDADKKAHLRTTATLLGSNTSLFTCFILWLITAIAAITITPWLIFLFLYPIIALCMVGNKKTDINTIYWYFPYINIIAGFLIYLITVLVSG